MYMVFPPFIGKFVVNQHVFTDLKAYSNVNLVLKKALVKPKPPIVLVKMLRDCGVQVQED